MSGKKLRVGIAGIGNISEIHAQAVQAAAGGELVAAHSRNKEKLKRFCKRFDIEGESDYDRFLKNPDLDLVAVCTPSGTHLDYSRKAAQAGKHVVIEKPIEVTLERASGLLDACRKAGVKVAVIYQNRFLDDTLRMKTSIQDGQIGEPFMATASVKWYRSQEYYEDGGWRGTLDLDGGGAVINQAIHTVDLLEWMLGPIKTVRGLKGTFTHPGIEGEDNAVAALEFSSGAIGTFVASTSIRPAQPRTIEVHGDLGTAQLTDNDFQLLLPDDARTETGSGAAASGAEDPMANLAFEPHRRQFDEIFSAILEDKEPVVSGRESLRSLAAVMALYRSAESGKPAHPDELIEQALR